MNILTDDLPESVSIKHTEYQVRSSFRDCLRIMLAFEDSELTKREKMQVLLSMYMGLPKDIEEAIKQANWFLNCGEEGKSTSGPRVYSFAKDAPMIFAAFKQVHGIDLTQTDLHWWQFTALFQAVIAHQENAFGQLVTLRHKLKTGSATKEERDAARKIPDLIDIPDADARTLEEREAEQQFNELIAQGKRNREKNNGNSV